MNPSRAKIFATSTNDPNSNTLHRDKETELTGAPAAGILFRGDVEGIKGVDVGRLSHAQKIMKLFCGNATLVD